MSCAPQPIAVAQADAGSIESDVRLDPQAIAVNEVDEAAGLWQAVAYFPTFEDAERARDLLGLSASTITTIPDVDWVRESLRGLAPVIARRFFLYGSHDRQTRRSGGISLELDAQTAFGTGHHGTTAGCLLAFDRLARQRLPRNVLDLGCGTGVLALAAAKLHCRNVLATDIDPVAVDVTKSNARINDIAHGLTARTSNGLAHRSIHEHAPYDLIFANILARPLAQLATGIAHLLAPGGHVILSGLTQDQARWIKACYVSRGLSAVAATRREGWATLVLRK